MKETLIGELNFCMKLREAEGGCAFGGGTKCDQCAVPYLLLKLINGTILHGNIKRLSLNDWKNKMEMIQIK